MFSQNWWIYVFADSSTLVCLRKVVHWKNLLMSSFLFLHQCPLYRTRHTCIACEISGKWPCNCCSVRWYFQDLLKTVPRIFVYFPSNFLSRHFFRVHTLFWNSNIVIYEALCFDVVQGRLMGHPMRLELILTGLLVRPVNHYTTRG